MAGKNQSETMHVRVRGSYACFTRPECRTERFSNVVPSMSGWDGLLSRIQGHPGTRYQTERVGLLFFPRLVPVASNEVKHHGGSKDTGPIDVLRDSTHTLRTSMLLAGNQRTIRDPLWDTEEKVSGVDYLVSFRVLATEKKYADMTRDRLRNGHYNGMPYLGIAKFPALVERVENFDSLSYPTDMPLVTHPDGMKTADYSAPLGLCFYGTDWDDPARPNYFAPLTIQRGVVVYPTWAEVKKLGIKRRGPQTPNNQVPVC